MNLAKSLRIGTMLALVIAGVLAVSGVNNLSAQTLPPAPREASAVWTVATNTTDSVVTVKWAKPLTDSTVTYIVYFAKGVVTSATSTAWQQILKTSSLSATFTLKDLGLDLYQTVSFKIKAVMHDTLVSDGAAYAVAAWNGGTDNPMKFTTTPKTAASMNVTYVYEAKATSTAAGAVITYSIVTGPDGMTIDTSTGRLTWTPSRSGTYSVTIKAVDGAGHSVTQSWTITVAAATDQVGFVNGYVVDSANTTGINGATVVFYAVANGAITKAAAATTVSTGRFEIKIAPGTYRVQAMASGYDSKYWDGAFNGDNAKLLTVVDSGVYSVTISLGAVVTTGYSLSGVVYNEAGKGVAGATVIAILKGDKNATGYGTQYSTTTNGDGAYSFTVPAGTYIVHAAADGYSAAWADSARELAGARPVDVGPNAQGTANIVLGPKATTEFCVITGIVKGGDVAVANAKVTVSSTTSSNTSYSVTCVTNGEGRYTASVPCGQAYIVYAAADGYAAQYYDNQNSPLDAMPVKAVGTVTANFTLTATSTKGVVLAGVVYTCDSALTKETGKATLYRIGDNTLNAVATVVTTDGGAYTFTNVDTGVYLVQAYPNDTHFAPSYYNDSKSCTTEWQQATRITVSGDRSQDGLNIYCKKISARRGFAKLIGHVRNVISAVGTSYLAGGLVFASDAQGNLAGFTATDTSGYFEIDSVVVGTYSLVVDKAQYQTLTSITLTTDYDANSAASGDISAQKQTVSAVKDPVAAMPTAMALSQNYPNPFNPTTEITFALPISGNATLAVYAMTGQRVAILAGGFMQAGTYHATFDATTLPSGTYVYRLETAQGVIARRMVELK